MQNTLYAINVYNLESVCNFFCWHDCSATSYKQISVLRFLRGTSQKNPIFISSKKLPESKKKNMAWEDNHIR